MSSIGWVCGLFGGFGGAFVVVVLLIRVASDANAVSSNPAPRPQRLQRPIPLDSLTLRRLRQQERTQWAREDLESAREEKWWLSVLQVLPQDEDTNNSATRTTLLDLPLELRIQIYSQLDYGFVLRLGATCRKIYLDDPCRYVDQEQRATYVYHAETFPQNMRTGRLACYSCLRVKNRRCFRDERWVEEFIKFGPKELERMCFPCRIEKGKVSWTELMVWKGRRFFHLRNE